MRLVAAAGIGAITASAGIRAVAALVTTVVSAIVGAVATIVAVVGAGATTATALTLATLAATTLATTLGVGDAGHNHGRGVAELLQVAFLHDLLADVRGAGAEAVLGRLIQVVVLDVIFEVILEAGVDRLVTAAATLVTTTTGAAAGAIAATGGGSVANVHGAVLALAFVVFDLELESVAVTDVTLLTLELRGVEEDLLTAILRLEETESAAGVPALDDSSDFTHFASKLLDL